MSRTAADRGCLVYVGNLPVDVREREVEDLFAKYGRIRYVELKTPARPPPYAFVEFDDPRDAHDAVRGRDNYDFYGSRLRVELARGSRGGDRGGGRTTSFRPPNTGYRVLVHGLPGSASWQDLKDHFRRVARPTFTDIVRERDGPVGIVEFDSEEDMDRAIRKLDDTEFKNPFDSGVIRVEEDRGGRGGGGRGRGRSASPRRKSPPRGRRSRSPRRSPSRSRSRSRSPRKRSPARGTPSPGMNPSRSDRSGSPKAKGRSVSFGAEF
jgi:splicing factor, arginine/serine-rich 1